MNIPGLTIVKNNVENSMALTLKDFTVLMRGQNQIQI